MPGKKKWVGPGLLLIFLMCLAIPAAAVEIKWERDYQASLAKAKAEKKPILLDFFNPK
jgi:hypothetical protein